MLEVSNNCSPSPFFASGFLPPKTLFLFPPATASSAWSHSTGNAIKCFTSIPAHVHTPRNAFARKRLSVLGNWYRGKLDVIQISPRDQVDRQRGWRNWPGTSKIHPWAIRGLFFFFLVVILSWRTMKQHSAVFVLLFYLFQSPSNHSHFEEAMRFTGWKNIISPPPLSS